MFVCPTGRSQSMQSLNRSVGGGDTFRLRRGQGRVFRGNNSRRRPFRRGGSKYFVFLSCSMHSGSIMELQPLPDIVT